MFNDKFGLTQAVLDGRKTQTRRIMKGKPLSPTDEIESAGVFGDVAQIIANGEESLITMKLPYKHDEVVAVAQSYASIIDELEDDKKATCARHYEKNVAKAAEYLSWMEHPGFNNKMFTSPKLMLHQMHITDVRVERLQDISDYECIREGVHEATKEFPWYWYEQNGKRITFNEQRRAFAHLIDKVSGKGTWDSNPYVFVYDFELIR